MSEQAIELEHQLKVWGCPYKATDPKARVWLEGYRVGLNAGGSLALETAREVFLK